MFLLPPIVWILTSIAMGMVYTIEAMGRLTPEILKSGST